MTTTSFTLPFTVPVTTKDGRSLFVQIGGGSPTAYLSALAGLGYPAIAAVKENFTVASAQQSPYNTSANGNPYLQVFGLADGVQGADKILGLLASSMTALNLDLILAQLDAAGGVVAWNRVQGLGSLLVGGNLPAARYAVTTATRGTARSTQTAVWVGDYAGVRTLVGVVITPMSGLSATYGLANSLKTGLTTIGTGKGLKAHGIGSTLQHTLVMYLHGERLRSFVWHADNTVTATWINTLTTLPEVNETVFDVLIDPLVANAAWVAIARHNTSTQTGNLRVLRLTNLDSATPTIGSVLPNTQFGTGQMAYHVGLSLGNLHTAGGDNRVNLTYSVGPITSPPSVLPLFCSVYSADLVTTHSAAVAAGKDISTVGPLSVPNGGLPSKQYGGVAPYHSVTPFTVSGGAVGMLSMGA